jgi:hypothetical protein
VQFCTASLLATLILDDAAMQLIRERREAPVLFEAALQLLSETVERIRCGHMMADQSNCDCASALPVC